MTKVAHLFWRSKTVPKMRRSRNPNSSSTGQASSSAAGSSGSSNTNTVPTLLKELHGLVLQIQVVSLIVQSFVHCRVLKAVRIVKTVTVVEIIAVWLLAMTCLSVQQYFDLSIMREKLDSRCMAPYWIRKRGTGESYEWCWTGISGVL